MEESETNRISEWNRTFSRWVEINKGRFKALSLELLYAPSSTKREKVGRYSRPPPTRNSRHEIRMSYGFHSSERINRRRTKISIHVRSRSHSVTVSTEPPRAPAFRFESLKPTAARYLRPCNELSTECSFRHWLSRGLSWTLTRLLHGINCSPITGFNIFFFFFFFHLCICTSNSIGNFYCTRKYIRLVRDYFVIIRLERERLGN